MLHRLILPLALTALLLAGCAYASVKPDANIAIVPPAPPDILTCRRGPAGIPDEALPAGTVERLWKTDRARLAAVDRCLCRLIVQYCTLRKGLSDAGCEGVVPEMCEPGFKAKGGKAKAGKK